MVGIADIMLPKLLTPETVSKRPEVGARARHDVENETEGWQLRAAAEREDQTELL